MATHSDDRSVRLSAAGTDLPLIGLGTWQLRGRQGYDAVRYALDIGYRHLDTATNYGNEAEIGRAMRDSGVPREEIFVTTKLPAENEGSEEQTLAASLDALDTDYVDLWLIHWPPRGATGIDVWRALLAMRDKGLARAVGVSNYSSDQIDELAEVTGEAPAVNQIRWSPAIFDGPRLERSRRQGVVLEGYSPFKAGGLNSRAVKDIAAEHGVSAGQVVLRWHVEHGVVAIPKSARSERIRANLDVFGFALSPEQIARIDALGHPVPA